MQISGIHHVQLAMPPGREKEATDFYEGMLGIPRVDKPAPLAERGGCWFELGETRIHLGVEPDFKPATKAHPALLVTDVTQARSRLESAGVDTFTDESLPGFDRFYASDPFGNRIEFLTRIGL